MNWFRKLFGLKEKEKVPSTELGSQEEPIKQEIQEDTRKILTDKNGEDLICPLCENQDNETGEYFPIREGDKRNFNGKDWHTKCLRAIQKESKKGGLM